MKKILLTLFVAFFAFLTYAAAAYQPHFSRAASSRLPVPEEMPTL